MEDRAEERGGREFAGLSSAADSLCRPIGRYRTCWTAYAEKGGGRECLPPRVLAGREARRSRRWLCRCRLGFVGEVEVGEVGLCPVGGELDGGLERFVKHERVAVKRG